jgi:hypothetical protein
MITKKSSTSSREVVDSTPFIYTTTLYLTDQFHSIPVRCELALNITAENDMLARKPTEYWNHKRSQHWTTYPNFPISTGIVRQKYRDIARLYDRQQLVHPAIVGFCIRFKGHPKDEVNFIHPMFTDFSLVRKPLPGVVLEEIRRQAQLGQKTNPFKYKPIGDCPICYDHQPVCPRCFAMPTLPNGELMRPTDFQFDPEVEQKEKAEKEFKQLQKDRAEKMKSDARRALLAAGRTIEEDSDEEEMSVASNSVKPKEVKPTLHTKLTTEKGLTLYRTIVLHLLTVYVKVMPGHDVVRVQLDPNDNIWHLHNMFKTHHPLGHLRGSMMILPTSNGLYQMDADMIPENEFLKARRTALILMKDYGFLRRNSSIVVLYVPYYKDDTIIPIMKKYIKENLMAEGLNFDIPNITHNKTIPESLESDPIQANLLKVVIRSFHDNQIHIKAKYQILGQQHRERMKKLADERQKALIVSIRIQLSHILQAKRLEEDRLRIQEEKEITKQLKGLKGEELEQAKAVIYQQRQTKILEVKI